MIDVVICVEVLDLIFEINDGLVYVLKNVDFEINKGDFVLFIGLLGCGKIIFFCCVVVFEMLIGGLLIVNGMMFDEVCCVWVYGYVFQVVGFYLWCMIVGNIKLFLEIMGMDKVE